MSPMDLDQDLSRDKDGIVQALKQKGLRVTPQRCAIYANLRSRSDHPTVEQLLLDLNQSWPLSSKATVYSSLQALRDVGLVREVLLDQSSIRFDANTDPHHHFRCCQCGGITDLEWHLFPSLNLELLPPTLKPQSYEITVHGVCEICAQTSPE